MLDSIPSKIPSIGISGKPADSDADVVVIALDESGTLSPTLAELDEKSDGWFTRLIEANQLRGKKGDLSLLGSPLREGPRMVLVVGQGDRPVTRSLAFESAASAIRLLSDRVRKQIVVCLGESFPESMHDCLVAGAITALEGQAIYQTDPPTHPPEEILFAELDEAAITKGRELGLAMNVTRRLVNEPAGNMYPESFAETVTHLAKDAGIRVEVWDEPKLKAEGCRAILAVGAGSARPSRLVVLHYEGGGDEPPLALVGKGVTFDSGGLSLKPSDSMADMKCDMAGAATVVGTMLAVAKLGLKQNVIGYCGLAENMISGESYKLGDVIETRSGKTVEILNTDAEGRVVLADTLDVAIQNQPRAMVDLATLTGACMVALGHEVAGLMTNNSELCTAIRQAADEEGEPVWELPMFELYDDKVKSKVADIKNVGEGRWGGAITAAKFLENFVGDTPWLHIDIAGPAFVDSPLPHRDAGATAAMVRTLVRWVESQ